MTVSKNQNTETKTKELSEVELNQASGGIIAVLRKSDQMGDGSVVPSPMTTEAQRGIIAI